MELTLITVSIAMVAILAGLWLLLWVVGGVLAWFAPDEGGE